MAVHGVKQMGDVAGMNIAVLGAGPIGNLVAQAAKGMGAAKVMITDISDLRPVSYTHLWDMKQGQMIILQSRLVFRYFF